MTKGTRNTVRSEFSLDLEDDQYVNFDRTPLCYDSWIHTPSETNDDMLRSHLLVTSSARGSFGVDYSMQQFGHGDTIMLTWILDKYRSAPPDFTEFGTFGGVTALYLGMAARLRGGSLYTFDISDDRSQEVKNAWLPNMKFNLGDANHPAHEIQGGECTTHEIEVSQSERRVCGHSSTFDEAIRSIQSSGVILVDHADRLNFTV